MPTATSMSGMAMESGMDMSGMSGMDMSTASATAEAAMGGMAMGAAPRDGVWSMGVVMAMMGAGAALVI